MEQLTKLMLQSEDKMEVQKRKFKGKNKRDVWSTFWATKSRYMTLLKRIIACAAVKRDRHKVRKLLRQLKPDNDTHLQYGLDELPQVPETAAPHAEWCQYRKKATEMIRTKQQQLHLRDRRKNRLSMKKALAIRDKQMRNQREVGQWIKWALKRTPRESKPTVLLQKTDKGITVTDTPKAMSALERKLTKKHMGYERQRWYLNKKKMLPQFNMDNKGHRFRIRIQTGKWKKRDRKVIPQELHGVFQCARAVKNNKDLHTGTQTVPRKEEKEHSTRSQWAAN
jgi:hypothetical protein